MDHQFWHDRWQSGRIAFHEGETNALLERHFSVMGLAAGKRIFVPLCGKAMDLAWLAAQNHEVIGAELDDTAVAAFFEEQGLTPSISKMGALKHHTSGPISIFQGDVFALEATALGQVDAVYDRAALVALPEAMRKDYAPHILKLTGGAPLLLVTFEYSNPDMVGPPHSVQHDEIERLYGETHRITEIERRPITGPLRERTEGEEVAWTLQPR